MRFSHLVLALVPALIGGDAVAQETRPPVELRRLATWASSLLRESSGLVASRQFPGVLWTHNDSGDDPILYATDTLGALRAAFEVVGARNVDWEALSMGPCPAATWDGRICLYVADTGDNDEKRGRVTIYAFPEPDPGRTQTGRLARTDRARTLRLRYPDRPRDAEAMIVFPDGAIAIITKGRSPPVLRFEVPPEAWQSKDVHVPSSADTLPIDPQLVRGRWVTDAALAPDGRHAVVRTYTEVYRFRLGARWELAGPICLMGLVEPQGEAITFLDAEHMLLASEGLRGRPGGLTILRCAWE